MNEGLDLVVERMKNISNKLKEKSFSILMLVPESLVSVLIGNRGQMIRKLASETKAEIVVNQPVHSMKHRTVKITGKHYYVSKCMRHINRLMLEKQAEIDFRPRLIKTVDVKMEQITSRFIFPKKLVEYLGNNHGKFVEMVKMKYNVMIKFFDDHEIYYILKRDELVCQIQGKLQQVQEMMIYRFFEAIEDFYKKNKLDYLDVDVKILIPFKFITKIIGANGCMIKEIAQKSHGANIKALSDKFSHKQKETALSINGSITSKKYSVCIILEQIEIFRNGGPMLNSGIHLDSNIAEQFKNSVQMEKILNGDAHTANDQQMIQRDRDRENRDRDREREIREREREIERERDRQREFRERERERDRESERELQRIREREVIQREREKERERDRDRHWDKDGLMTSRLDRFRSRSPRSRSRSRTKKNATNQGRNRNRSVSRSSSGRRFRRRYSSESSEGYP